MAVARFDWAFSRSTEEYVSAPGGHQKRGAAKREAIVAFVGQYVDEHGYSPTYREIMAACDIGSASVAEWHVGRLARDGRITRVPGVPRTIRVLAEAR